MNRIPYVPEEDEIIRRLWPSNSAADVGELIDRTVSSVDNRAHKLGLRKAAEYIARNSACFRPGNEAHNKGRPVSEWNPNAESCRATQFKRGERRGAAQHNYVPVGTEKVRDGLLCRKVTDDPDVFPAARWVPISRLVWEAANGPIPEGHAVIFKPGRATTDRARITPDAVELVSRPELMRRNSRHNRYPPELNALMQLKGALNRKINNRNRKDEEQNL